MERRWRSVHDLARMLIERGRAGRSAVLTPDTAFFIGLRLRSEARRPVRDEIGRVLCKGRCERLCDFCLARANEIESLYREGIDR